MIAYTGADMGSLQLRMYDYRDVPTPVLWSMSGDQRDVWHHVVLTFEEIEGPFQVTCTSCFTATEFDVIQC